MSRSPTSTINTQNHQFAGKFSSLFTSLSLKQRRLQYSMDPKLIKSSQYSLLSIFLAFLLFASLFPSSTSQLSTDFYSTSCPNVEMLVRNTVRSAVAFDPTLSGKLLRLLFHDCIVEGCDGSVLVRGNGTERSDPANKSLGGFEVVESAKSLLEVLCPGAVSCADVLVMVARDAVEMVNLKLLAIAILIFFTCYTYLYFLKL